MTGKGKGDSMILPESEAKLFYRLQWGLMFYANNRHQIIPNLKAPDFKGVEMEKIGKLDKCLYSHPELIESFASENPLNFSEKELATIKSWKNFLKGEFMVYRHLKNGAVFLDQEDDPKAYLVTGIMSELEEMFPDTPLMAETILLSFKGRIVYNGLIRPYNITFGRGIKADLEERFRRAKIKYGLITSLEELPQINSDIEKETLKHYAGSEANILVYREEANKIMEKNMELQPVYFQEMAKTRSRSLRKHLWHAGVNDGTWFATLETITIASGSTEEEARRRAEQITPSYKHNWIYMFRYNDKKPSKGGFTGEE